MRNEYLSEQFNSWLERYAPPRYIADKPEGMQQEADTLLRIIAKHAPNDGYAEWLETVLRSLTEGMTARTWPTGGEVSKACRENARYSKSPIKETSNRDLPQIEADRMNAGEAVSDASLYGSQACELIARGLVDKSTMERYRRAAFNSRSKFYGDEAAIKWESEAKAKHDAARQAWKGRAA
jgi:hypothetical protein